MDMVTGALLWFALISSGLMAGLYFAFSTFVMRALAALPHPGGMEAMNAMNGVIVRTLFLPLFLVSTAACAVLAVIGALRWGDPGAAEMLFGSAAYVLGMTVVTMRANVPLNNALTAAGADSAGAAELWRDYCLRWTRWNHVRTIASTAALVLFAIALAERW